jgi:hypothetical protein
MLAKSLCYTGVRGLGVVQMATADQDSLEYISSEAAIKGELLRVTEVSQSGSVNELLVLNGSDQHVFLMDGDILLGAKQNRVLNTSVLLPPRSKIRIPVSCVERGRWQYHSPAFRSSDFVAPTFLRSEKARQVSSSLKSRKSRQANQGEIWKGVDRHTRAHGVASPTDSLADIYARKEAEFRAFVEQFRPDPGANGMAVFRGNSLVSVDLFNRREIYAEYFPKILRGIASDTLLAETRSPAPGNAEACYRAVEFIDALEAVEGAEFPGVGVGTERRFETAEVTGFELKQGKFMVHCTALRIPSEAAR